MTVLQVDLSPNDSPEMIFDFVNDRNMSVNVLVNKTCAGVSAAVRNYAEKALLEMMVLNMFSVTAICKYFVPQKK